MRLIRATFKNWGCLEDLSLEFKPGINGILGPNGSGKSTVVDGLRWANTGVSISPGNKAANLRTGADAGFVSSVCSHGDVTYEIKRHITTARQSLKLPDGTQLLRQNEIEGYLESLLSTKMSMLLNNVFIGQHAIDAILFKAPSERLREFQEAFDMNRVSAAYAGLTKEIGLQFVTPGLQAQYEIAVTASSEAVAQLKEANERLVAIALDASELPDCQAKLNKHAQSIRLSAIRTRSQKELAEAQANLSEATGKLKRLEGDRGAISAAFESEKTIAEGRSSTLADLRSKKRQKAEDLESEVTVNNQLSTLPAGLSNESVEECRTSIATLSEKQARLIAIREGKAPIPKTTEDVALDEQLREAVELRATVVGTTPEELATLKVEIPQLEERLEVFKTGKCPTCGHEVEDFNPDELAALITKKKADQARIVAERDKSIKSAEALIVSIRKNIAQRTAAAKGALDSTLSDITGKLTNAAAMLKTAIDTSTRQASLAATLAAIKKRLETYDPAIDGLIIDLESKLAVFKEMERDYTGLNTEISVQRMSVSAIQAQVKALEATIASTSADDGLLTDEELKNLTEKAVILSARTQLREAVALEVGVLEAKVSQLSGLSSSLKEQLAAEKSKIDWTKTCTRVRDVFHLNNLPTILMREYASRINRRMAYYMAVWEAPFQLYINDQLEFIARFPDGLEMSGARLSGGQKIVASTSFRLAMSDTFARSVGLLILDEPTNHLDRSNITHLQQLLLKLKTLAGATGRQIIIITHEESLVGFFDHTIRLGIQ